MNRTCCSVAVNRTYYSVAVNRTYCSYLGRKSQVSTVCDVQDTTKLLQLNKGQVVTAYSAFQRLAQKSGSPGAPVCDPPSQLPPIPVDAQKTLDTVGLTEDGVPNLIDIGYHDPPTSPFKVI